MFEHDKNIIFWKFVNFKTPTINICTVDVPTGSM